MSTLLAEHLSHVDIVWLLLFCVPSFHRVATEAAEDDEEDGEDHEDIVAHSATVSDTDEQET